MDVVTYALAQKYVKNAIGSLDTVTDVTVDGNSVVNADGVAEIVTPQILDKVADVKVNGQSVVDSEGVAQITLHDTTLANNFADEYDASTSYEVGNLCIKDLVLYRCTTATTGTWDDTKWEEITVAEILDAIKTVINSLMVDIDIEVISRLIQNDDLLDIMNYGDQLNINWANGTTNYDMPLNFCHLETAKDENDNDVKVADFESEYVLPFDCIFDAPEAIFASASDLEAGDYYFKIVNDAWGGNNGKYVSFTLDATLETGKQIRKKSGNYDAAIENCTLGIFTDGTDTTGTTLSFTVSTTQPSTGTNLGQTDGTGDLNHWHCIVLGYNRWKFSAVRQFLNSDATKGNWWVQQHKWDVRPSYATTADGFLYGLSASIKNHLKTTKIQTARNTVFNSGDTPLGDLDTTYDKVFLASLEQMYIEPQVTGEGDVWEYYKLLNGTSTKYQRSSTYADLIKYDISAKTTARYRWLRSCYRSSAHTEWVVSSSGSVYNGRAYFGYRLAPAMRIG